MTITVVQSATAAPGGSPGTFVVSLGSAPTTGNSLIWGVGANADQAINTVVDNQSGNTWIRGPHALASNTFNGTAEIWYLPSLAYQSGTFTITATPQTPASGGNPGVQVIEVSGLNSVSPLDQQGTAADAAGAATSLTVTCTGANTQAVELVFAIMVKSTDTTNFSAAPNSGYTPLAVFNGNSNGVSTTGGYKITAGIETSSASASWSTGGVFAAGAIATFLQAGSTGVNVAWLRA